MRLQAPNLAVINSLASPIAVLDASGVIVPVNDAWEMFATDNGADDAAAQCMGTNCLSNCAGAKGSRAAQAGDAHAGISAVLNGERDMFTLEYPCHCATKKRWLLMTATPYKGFPGHAVVTHLDITERKLAELRNASFDYALEDSASELYIFDAQGLYFIRVNEAGRRNLGYSMDELRGMTRVDITPGYTLDQFQSLVGSMDDQPLDVETVHQRKDGSTYPVKLPLKRTLLDDTLVFVATIHDITERKQAEHALRAANDELEALVLARTEALREATAVAVSATTTKSHFLAAASHDLRQPLQAATLYLALLKRQLKEPNQLSISDKMGQSFEAKGELLDALLDIARLDTGMQNVHKRDLSVRTLLKRIVNGSVQQGARKGLELTFSGADCVVHSDASAAGARHRELRHQCDSLHRARPRDH